NGNSYTETIIYACSGTYKGGKIDYTETATKDVIAFTDGFTCTAQTPYVFEHLEGTFADGKTINGTFSNDAVTYNCSDGKPQQIDPEKGTCSCTPKLPPLPRPQQPGRSNKAAFLEQPHPWNEKEKEQPGSPGLLKPRLPGCFL